jgi:hypothetical protein
MKQKQQQQTKQYTLMKNKVFISGSAEEIISTLKSLSWDEVESNKEYMHRVKRRVKQLHGVEITTASPEAFLEDLHDAEEVKLFEESLKKKQ